MPGSGLVSKVSYPESRTACSEFVALDSGSNTRAPKPLVLGSCNVRDDNSVKALNIFLGDDLADIAGP